MSTMIHPEAAELFPVTCKRLATRYEPARRDACLAWWDQPAEERAPAAEPVDDVVPDPESKRHFALLLDISHTGASLALDRVPDAEAGVWMRLEGQGVTDWTEAQVVGVTTTAHGPHLVRLAFRAPCPFETLMSAICE